MSAAFDPQDDPRFDDAEPSPPASGPGGGWDETLYDKLSDIVDDAAPAVQSWQPGTLFSRERLIMIAGLIVVGVLVWLTVSAIARQGANPAAPGNAGVATSTATPTPLLVAAPPSPTPTLTPTPTPTPTPGIQIGARVRITITDGSGMRFRSGPGTDYITLAIMPDGTEFRVVDGPQENADGTWWRLEAEDGTIGWGAANLLELVGG